MDSSSVKPLQCIVIITSRRDELDFVNSNVAGEQISGYDQNYASSSGNGYDNTYATAVDYPVGGGYAENPYYNSYADNRNYELVDSDVKSFGYGEGV